jgi:hypothetical protein
MAEEKAAIIAEEKAAAKAEALAATVADEKQKAIDDMIDWPKPDIDTDVW